ncbi:MAG: hypothetical protein HYV26_23905, partial [Candidatus Hydrogenedentes bacterium]|nr:hypothetical protein [Candidatus Hydrogenedentota bacterium]
MPWNRAENIPADELSRLQAQLQDPLVVAWALNQLSQSHMQPDAGQSWAAALLPREKLSEVLSHLKPGEFQDLCGYLPAEHFSQCIEYLIEKWQEGTPLTVPAITRILAKIAPDRLLLLLPPLVKRVK